MLLLIVKVFLYAVLAVFAAVLWRLYPVILRQFTSPLKNIPGPPSPSWFRGNSKAIEVEDNSVPQERWAREYNSHTITYKGPLSMDRLWSMDTRVANHVLTHSAIYQKGAQGRAMLATILGKGLLFVEGEQHRQQRRILNPAFGPSHLRELTEIFVDKSIELRDALDAQIANADNAAQVEILSWLSRMTLDVIGIAGFNYEFHSLNPHGEPNELNEAFNEMFNPSGVRITPLAILRNIFPALKFIPDERSRRNEVALSKMRKVGLQLIAEKKAAIMRETAEGKEKSGIERKDVRGRDLLTLLLKANMTTDIPDNQRLTDEDVLAQVPTFLVAGHETTSTSTMWCLFALTQAPEVQKKLRDELYTLDTDTPTMDQLSSLPYLDMVVRETLRVHAPVPMIFREATEDDVIPVSEPFVDRYVKVQNGIRVNKGTPVAIPILAINRSKKLWGEDAFEFKPERWENLPEAVSSIPGVWAHLMSFIGGPRACIGYRFSLVEMKALLFVLLRAFEFELAVPAAEIQKKSAIVQRPLLRSAPEKGSQMPMIIRRHKRT